MVVNKFAFVVRFAELSILRYKLAQIFKQAELQAERGVEKGSPVYVTLLGQAQDMLGKFTEKWPGNYANEFPALSDLDDLATPPEPVKAKPVIGVIAATTMAIISIAFAAGAFGAVVHFAYHLIIH